MTITNGYATRADVISALTVSGTFSGTSVSDDNFIDSLVEDASREIDRVCGRFFYAYGSASAPITRYYNAPLADSVIHDERMGGGTRRAIYFVEDCIDVTSITNGDGNTVPLAQVVLWPFNETPYFALSLKRSSSYAWLPDSSGNLERVIQIAGIWGFCDRTATDPISARAVSNTKRACVIIAASLYRQRAGQTVESAATITGAGVVLTPQGIPKSAWELLRPYVKGGAA